jgi:molybdopterin converting factor small subunit
LSEVTVVIPTALRAFTQGEQRVVVEADTVGQALGLLEDRYSGVLPQIVSPDGKLRPFVNLFVGETSTRSLAGMATSTPHGSVLSIIPAVAGG